MTNIPPPDPITPLPADVDAELDRYLVEIRVRNELMRPDQAVIDRLEAETAALKAETRAINEETRAIMAQTWGVISRLQAAT